MSENTLSPQHKKVVNAYLMGDTKRAACVKAGFSPLSSQDIFGRADVRAEIERRIKVSEEKTDMDRAWLLEKLKQIIEASPGDLIEVDAKGRPSLNFNNLTPSLRKVIGKVTIDHQSGGGKYKRDKTHVSISVPDKINAIKEAAVLLGLREEKHKIDMEERLIEELVRRRKVLAGEEEEKAE